MNPIDIGKAYDKITHLWESEKFNKKNGIDALSRSIEFVKARGHALDVGCGCTGRFIDCLLESNFKPEGIDISDKMLCIAKKVHPQVKFYKADICEWEPPKKYDLITAWDSIWHIPLDSQEKVLTKLVSCLNTNGVLIFSCGGTDVKGDQKDDFMGPEVYYSSLGVTGFMELIIKLGCIARHFEYDQYPELHSYFIVQKA